MAKAPAKVRGRYTGAFDTGRSRVAYAAGRLKTAAMLLTRIVSLIQHGEGARESPRPLHRRLRHRALPPRARLKTAATSATRSCRIWRWTTVCAK